MLFEVTFFGLEITEIRKVSVVTRTKLCGEYRGAAQVNVTYKELILFMELQSSTFLVN